MSVAIVGIGIHPFGRFEGVTGSTWAPHAVRQALARRRHRVARRAVRVGGSLAAMLPGATSRSDADQLVNQLGLTGLQFTNVHNGCATAGSTLAIGAARSSSRAQYDLGVCVGFDKHPRGHFNADAGAARACRTGTASSAS